MKKLMAIMALFVLILSNICGYTLINTLADETTQPELQKYYTSIEIQKDDSLWKIAEEYAANCGMTTTDYVKELKRMNGLGEDVIHWGNYLTIMYCVPVQEVLTDH